MAAITTATGFDIAGMMLGLASSVVLLVWSIRLGPLQRSLAKLDVIPPESPLTEVVVTDTMPLSEAARKCGKVKQVSIAKLLGEAIRRIHHGDSVSSLFG